MKLIVGLGNPGNKYEKNRHNIGFQILDLCTYKIVGASPYKEEKKALVCKTTFEGVPCLFIKPQTYMNLSGESVRALMDYYKIGLEEILVVHDDLDQEFAQMKFQKNRGAGGNNGIKSIHQYLGTQDYARLKIGIGKPNGKQDVADYVLQNFSKEELGKLEEELYPVFVDAVFAFIRFGFTKACDKYNGYFK